MRRFYSLIASAAFLFSAAIAHSQTVKGTVKDAAGALPGVIIKDETGNNGTATDGSGAYSLKLTAGKHTLEYTMLGYATQKKEVNLSADQVLELNITLEEESSDLDELVIVGYGVQRKREVTGSISKVEGKELTKLPVPSFEAALQGQAAGVQVTQGSGMAGSSSILRIRGIASISAGGDPLYVIDGIPIIQNQFIGGNNGAMNNNPLATINPSDIESIEILKDAAATGIYGSRGSNGVILITTKRGTKKKGVSFEFNTRFGIGTPASLPNMMNTDQYLAIRQEAWENDGGTGYVWLPGVAYQTGSQGGASALEREQKYMMAKKINTDWVDQTVGVGIKHMYNFAVNYGGEKSTLYAALTYDHNGSYLVGNYYERMTGRINYDYTFSKKLKMLTSLSYSIGNNQRVDAAWSGGLGLAMSQALPYYPVKLDSNSIALFGSDGEVGDYYMWNNGYTNPVAVREKLKWRSQEKRTISNLTFVYSPIKNLNLKLTGAYDYMDFADYRYQPIDLYPNSISNYAEKKPTWTNNWSTSFTADYRWQMNEDHSFTFLVGAEAQEQYFSKYDNITYNFISNPVYTNDFETDSTVIQKFIGTPEKWTFVSTFARVNYSIKDRYFFQAVSRLDGSSRFGVNNRYGFFPSLSAGWVVSEESWFKKGKAINFLKVRAGVGKSGNADIQSTAQFSTYSQVNNGITYNGSPIIYPIQLGNPDLQWETTTTYDATVEMGLWKDRVSATLSVYRKDTKNALMNVNVPSSTGFTNYWDNVATILNEGIELTITSYNIVKPNFSWKTDFNIARNYNELVDIGDYTPDAVSGGTNDSRVIVGKPIGSFYLMQFSHVDPTTGRPVYIDTNGNQTYDYDNNQRQYVGDGLPEAIGGITNTFTYKNWDCQFLATFSLGAKIFDSSGKRQLGVVTDWNMRTELLDRWRQPGDEATYPRLTLDETTYDLPSGFPWWNTSLFIYKADYLRLKNFIVGYTFKMKKESRINSLRVSGNVVNMFTITNFPGLDPELVRDFENAQDRNLSPNVTYLTPPQERSYNISISATF
ncbi:MAG: TonB-dependent receptor [Flavobacteriales bacterium]